MNFECKKAVLLEALLRVHRAVPAQSAIKELAGILITAKNGVVTLTGYDLSIGIVCCVSEDVDIIEEGSIVAPSVITDIIRRSNDEQVNIKVKDDTVILIKNKNSEYELFGMEAKVYPELPFFEKDSGFEVAQAVLRRMIRQTVYAVSTSEARPVQQGVLFERDEDSFTMAALDGFRMAVCKEKISAGTREKFIVPGRTLGEVLRVLTDNGVVGVSVGKSYASFDVNGCMIYTRLITQGDFINYKSIIPTSYNTSVTVKTRELIEAVERVSLLVDSQTGKKIKNSIVARFSENVITLGCVTMAGKAQDRIACEIKGNDIEVGINNTYLLDSLRAAECDEIIIRMTTTFAAIKLVPPNEEDFIFLVMPIRTRNEEQ